MPTRMIKMPESSSGIIDTSTPTTISGIIAGNGVNIHIATEQEVSSLPINGETLQEKLVEIGKVYDTNTQSSRNIWTGTQAEYDALSYEERDEIINELVNYQNYIPIADADDLKAIGGASTPRTFAAGTIWENTYTGGSNKKYVQVKDIDLTDVDWLRMEVNNITYDGLYFTISNLTWEDSIQYEMAFIGYAWGSKFQRTILNNFNITNKYFVEGDYAIASVFFGTLDDMIVEDCLVKNSIVRGVSYCGGFCGAIYDWGLLYNVISRCGVENVTVSIDEDNIAANSEIIILDGVGTRMGGFLGHCSLDDAIPLLIEDCFVSGGSVEGISFVGGFIGELLGGVVGTHYIKRCYASPNITILSTPPPESPELPSGTNCDGFAGNIASFGGNNSYCFFDENTTGYTSSDPELPLSKTTIEMKNSITYADWDLENIWDIQLGEYPNLTKSFPFDLVIIGASYDGIYKSLGEKNWSLKYAFGAGSHYFKILEDLDGTLYAFDCWFYKDYILVSEDEGETWQAKPLPGTTRNISAMELLDDGNLIAYIASGDTPENEEGFYKSINKGDTWNFIQYISEDTWIHQIENCGNGVLIATCLLAENTFRSSDSGETWSAGITLPAAGNYYSNNILSLGNGIILLFRSGDSLNSHDSILYRSVDYGLNWDIIRSFDGGDYLDTSDYIGEGIAFFKTREGNNHFVYKTEDYGLTWELSGGINAGNFCVFQDSIYAGANENGILYKSEDIGDTWDPLQIDLSGQYIYYLKCFTGKSFAVTPFTPDANTIYFIEEDEI